MKIKVFIAALLLTGQAHAMTAFLVDQYMSGMNRICIYTSAKGDHAITISASKVCPVTIQV